MGGSCEKGEMGQITSKLPYTGTHSLDTGLNGWVAPREGGHATKFAKRTNQHIRWAGGHEVEHIVRACKGRRRA